MAGLKTYRGEIVRDESGDPIAAEWPPLVDLETWEAVQAVLKANGSGYPDATRQLLSGVALCAVCEAPIQSGGARNGRRRYRCSRKGGHAYREAEPIDDYVSEVAIARLARPDASKLLDSPTSDNFSEIRREIAAITVRRDAIAEAYAEGSVSLSQFKAANNKLASRMADLEGRLPTHSVAALAEMVAARDPRPVWEALDNDSRRQVIETLMVVKLTPAGVKERAYLDVSARIVNPETIMIEWKTKTL